MNTNFKMGSKHIKRSLSLVIIAVLLVFGIGCGKENKYVNIGVNMSTEGMSTYLTYTANGFKKVSNYVFFSESSEASLDKIRMEKQGIDITYLPAEDLGLIKSEDNLTVVLPDCFEENGELKGVWVAKNSWLQNAPNYSKKLIEGFVMSIDYRAEHMNVSYKDAYRSMKDVRDFDWDVYKESMEYCAAYAIANKEDLSDDAFSVCDAEEMLKMLEGFENKVGTGYELSRKAYDKYKTSDSKSFEELFDYSLAAEALKKVTAEK